MKDKEKKQGGWKERIKSFSDEVFRNYLIVRIRWEISSLERKRSAQIKDLGNRIYYLIQRKKIEVPEVQAIFDTIQDLDLKIKAEEDRLRELIMRLDVSRQLPKADVPEPEKPPGTTTDKAAAEKTAPAGKETQKSHKKESSSKTSVLNDTDKMMAGVLKEVSKSDQKPAGASEKKKTTTESKPESKSKSAEKKPEQKGKSDKEATKEAGKKISSKSSEKSGKVTEAESPKAMKKASEK